MSDLSEVPTLASLIVLVKKDDSFNVLCVPDEAVNVKYKWIDFWPSCIHIDMSSACNMVVLPDGLVPTPIATKYFYVASSTGPLLIGRHLVGVVIDDEALPAMMAHIDKHVLFTGVEKVALVPLDVVVEASWYLAGDIDSAKLTFASKDIHDGDKCLSP